MSGVDTVEDVDSRLAEAVGLFALSDISLLEAAEAADVTRWELEDSLEEAGLAEPLGVEREGDVASEIDNFFED